MSEIVLNLIVLAVTAVIIIGIFVFLGYRKRGRLGKMSQVAKERGWSFEVIQQPLATGIRLSGKSAFGNWNLEARADATSRESGPGSSEIQHSTRWWTEDVRLVDRSVVIGPRLAQGKPAGLDSFHTPLLQMGLKMMLGNDADWVMDLAPIAFVNSALNQRFLCLGNNDRDVQRLISARAEQLLLKIPTGLQPVIKLRPSGLEIALLTVELKDEAELQEMIDLGNTLSSAWNSTE